MTISESAVAAEMLAQKAILITGTSSGIGRKITEYLAAKGYFIYAGVLHEADLQPLNAIKNVQALRLDVTNPTEIAAAVETVEKGGRGLYGLINNAGVVIQGDIIDAKPSEFDLVMAVNVYGPYRVTKAFAPLIMAEQGRIITIGSIAGILASPGAGVYSMSKHAMEAFTDSLAAEMQPHGVKVSIIEPGSYRSRILKSAAERAGQDPNQTDVSRLKEPDEVAQAAERALFEPNPKRRYMVVPTAHAAEATIRRQVARLVELNEGQPYTYDTAALVKMLEEAMKSSRPGTRP